MKYKPENAIVVVDMLYDFIDGSMACQNGPESVAEVAGMLSKAGRTPVMFIRDCHPADHCSFTKQGGPWPSHCVQGTRGAEIADELKPYVKEEFTFYKGFNKDKEQYSGFEGINEASQTLEEVLRTMDVSSVYVVGIATEYCVMNTAVDLLNAGFGVSVVEKALAWVDAGGHREALEAMRDKGIKII